MLWKPAKNADGYLMKSLLIDREHEIFQKSGFLRAIKAVHNVLRAGNKENHQNTRVSLINIDPTTTRPGRTVP